MCELCEMQKITHWYYEDSDFVVLDCKICKKPMVVYRPHSMSIPVHVMENIIKKCKELFGLNITFRLLQRRIKHHWHAHILK